MVDLRGYTQLTPQELERMAVRFEQTARTHTYPKTASILRDGAKQLRALATKKRREMTFANTTNYTCADPEWDMVDRLAVLFDKAQDRATGAPAMDTFLGETVWSANGGTISLEASKCAYPTDLFVKALQHVEGPVLHIIATDLGWALTVASKRDGDNLMLCAMRHFNAWGAREQVQLIAMLRGFVDARSFGRISTVKVRAYKIEWDEDTREDYDVEDEAVLIINVKADGDEDDLEMAITEALEERFQTCGFDGFEYEVLAG